ncbi:hypothetical protein V5N11_026561 [Cardamine amara subsp. amara]|uniref:Uncharacterized protein n=1 Tax=Cardamine amara subsp. amara TaxID=228776 RepID=A0ABD0ZND4_CARAN
MYSNNSSFSSNTTSFLFVSAFVFASLEQRISLFLISLIQRRLRWIPLSKIEKFFVAAENRHDVDDNGKNPGGGRGCVLMVVVVFKVFVVVLLALSMKNLAVEITLSAFILLFRGSLIEESKEETNIVPQPEKSSNWDGSSTLEKAKFVVEEKKEVQTIRDVDFRTEKSQSAEAEFKDCAEEFEEL